MNAFFAAMALTQLTSPVAEPGRLERKIEVTLRGANRLSPNSLKVGHWSKDGKRLVLALSSKTSFSKALSTLKADKSIAKLNPWVELPEGISSLTSVSKLKVLVDDLRLAKRELAGYKGVEIPSLSYLGALLQNWQQRAFPEDKPDWGKWNKAMEHRDAMPPAQIGSNGLEDAPTGTWTDIGPKNLDTPYRTYWGLPPVTGRVNAIAVDPTNSNIIYVGSAGGGVLKTTNGGTSWTSLSDSWPTLQVSCIAIDPTDANKIYVGTGDWDGFGGYGTGIMRSTNGGTSWTNVGQSTFGNYAVKEILVDPDAPATILVAASRGNGGYALLYRSTNSGTSWVTALATSSLWCDLSYSALSGGIRYIYAAGGGNPVRMHRSSDHGANWTTITTGLSSGYHDNLAIASSPTARDTVYLMSPKDNVVKKSVNAGGTWSTITGNLPTGYNWSQGWYDFQLQCSTKTGGIDVLYSSLIDLQVDNNADGTWASMGGPTFSGSAVLHNDQHCVAVDPSNSNVSFVGCDGGLYKLTFNPTTGAGTWNYLSGNLNIVQFYSLATHPTDASRMLGGTQDNATPWSGGNLASWDNVCGGDGVGVALIKGTPATMYGSYQGLGYNGSSIGVYKTTNSWSTSSFITTTATGAETTLFIPPMASDPSSSNMFVGTNYLYKYNGTTWTNRLGSQILAGANQAVSAISVAPSATTRIYTGSSDGQVWKTTNGGTNWTQINTGTPSLPVRYITSFSVSPTVQTDVLVGVSGTGSGHLWRCANTDAGTRVWANVSGSGATGLPDVPLNGIARDPDDSANVWYVATDVGVFMTTNGGSTWTNATQPLGLPNVQCNAITAEPGTRFLTVATFGRGMWRIGLPFSLCPTSATVVAGSLISGGVGDLCTSNNTYLVAFPDQSSLIANIEFSAISLIQSVSEVRFDLEYSVGRPGLSVNVDFYRYSNSTWVNQSGGAAATSDVTLTSTVMASASNFVQATTKNVKARVIFEPINDEDPSQDGWPHSIDMAKWTIKP